MPTNAERQAEARRQDLIIMRAVPALRRAVASEKNRYIRKSADVYRRTSKFSDDDFLQHRMQLERILYAHYLKIGNFINKEISNNIKAQLGGIERKNESKFEYFLKKWARQEAGRKAKPIAGTTQKDINRAVQKAFADEKPETVIIREILAVRGYSQFRADAVARTETHNAAMYSSITTADEYANEEGVTMLKIWSPTVDDRSREFHLEMENHPPIAMSAMFDVPNPDGGIDRMDRPGDQSAPAAQVINCRCVLTYEVK